VLQLAAAGSASLSIAALGAGCSVLRPSKTPNSTPTGSTSPTPVATSVTASPTSTPTPPLPLADAKRVRAALARLQAAGAQTAQAGVVQPTVRKPLRRLQRDQHAHAVAVARLAELPAPPTPTPTPTDPTDGKTGRDTKGAGTSKAGTKGAGKHADKPRRPAPATVYGALGATEKSVADDLRAQAIGAESGELAALFASAAASASCWQRWLARRAG